MLLLHACCLDRQREKQRKRVRVLEMAVTMAIAATRTVLLMHSLCSRHYITCRDLLPMCESPWSQLKVLQQDKGVLQLMGLTWSSFRGLLAVFAPILWLHWSEQPHAAHNLCGA